MLELWGTPTYWTWQTMKQRCLNPTNNNYRYYGGRGITIDSRWHRLSGFIADMGLRPAGRTLERLDNTKGYYKANCSWETRKTQQNNRRACRYLEFNGQRLTVTQWAEQLSMNPKTISNRLNCYGWSIERTLTEPAMERRYRNGRYKRDSANYV